MSSNVEHTDVGAYALGLLEEDDRRAFEDHLSTCPSCTAELSELSGVASALTGMGPVDPPEQDEDEVIDLLRRRHAEARKSRRGTLVMAAAAAVTLLVCGITIGSGLGDGTQAPVAAEHAGHLGPAEQFYAEGRPVDGKGSGGVTGGLVLESKDWGTHAALKLAGVKGPLRCELIAVSKSGERGVMTGWSVPPAGYGVPGSPEPLYMHGGSPWPLNQIDRFEVDTTAGQTILTVDV
ncbi:MAG: zf-HC2 domain-containing protein [Nonomuraea sp.]|nr:zf-HC2 domain-containing protein [Nonomuraea sp.]